MCILCLCQFIVLVIYLLLLIIYCCHSFILFICSILICSMFDFISFFVVPKKRFNSDPGLYSRYFDPADQQLYRCTRIPSSSMQVNKHHTSDCTDFVLVKEQVAYYDHRHSGIDETNIHQVVKAVEGETVRSVSSSGHIPEVPAPV